MGKVKCEKCNNKMNKSKKYNGNLVCFVCNVIYKDNSCISIQGNDNDRIRELLNK